MAKTKINRRAPPRDAPSTTGIKLQKFLAEHGYGSRRMMETWIEQGRVQVNGEPAHLGQRVVPTDSVQVDGGKSLTSYPQNTRVLVLNKTTGVVCTRKDPEGRPTVFSGLPKLRQGRWVSVGRLDIQTSGLLLLTNNGELANRMMHPSTGLDREYAVRVDGELSDEAVDRLKRGVIIDGEEHRFSDLKYFNGSGRNHWYHAVLTEGKNREVRRLFESEGYLVSRLKRVRYGPVILPSWLARGHVAQMNDDDLKTLCRLLQVPYEPRKRPSTAREVRQRKAERTLLLPYPALNSGSSTKPARAKHTRKI